MLSKDLTPTPKAVNIIRPSSHQQLNYSSSTDSSLISAASTYTTLSPMIRQPSVESNPGLSFFCQAPCSPIKQQPQQHSSFEKIQSQPLVISRINLTHRRPAVIEDIDIDDNEQPVTNVSEDIVKLSSFKTGFGIMTGGLASFMLRGNISQPVDDARANRKIQDLEIEKKSLLTLNQTLETVVKEQSNTISDLQDRLAAIERPLTPGLDTSISKNGIMSCADIILESSDLERCLEDEDAAFERIRIMLLDLIEQAQSSVLQNKKVSISRVVLTDADVNYNRGISGRPRSVAGTRNLNIIPNQQNRSAATRRTSLSSINNASTKQISFSPTTSPIPHRRYSIQRTPSAVMTKSASNSSMNSMNSTTSMNSTASSRASKYKKSQDSPKKWSN